MLSHRVRPRVIVTHGPGRCGDPRPHTLVMGVDWREPQALRLGSGQGVDHMG